MPRLTRLPVFLLVSVFLLLADALFVALNYWQDKQDLQTTLEQEGKRLQTAFDVASEMTLANMSQLATFVANDPRVRDTFSQAVEAAKQESGATDGIMTDHYRTQLYRIVSPSWHKMTEDYYVRQLHFHFGPGSTSFLRVHKPEKFGDNMDQLRFMVVDVNQDHIPRTGLELGRVYAGLRGIVPVFDNSGTQHLGALEAGTSYQATIQLLSDAIQADIAILLKEDRVEKATWSRPDEAIKADCGCFVEASSSDSLRLILSTRQHLSDDSLINQAKTELVTTPEGAFALTYFGIQDYIGQKEDRAEPVGQVLIWHEADSLLEDLKQDTWLNISVAFIGFIIIEFILFYAIRYTNRRLTQEVKRRTAEVELLNEELSHLANTDTLTGLYNRRFLMQRFEEEFSRASRENLPLSMIILDLDHFKRINDTYGHTSGDQVLRLVGAYLKRHSRSYDVAARYGGEEFCMLLPNTGQQDALDYAQRLCRGFPEYVQLDVGSHKDVWLDKRVPITCSVGVCERKHSDSAERLLSLADSALYAAKQQGRDRVVLYDKKDVLDSVN